MVFITAQPDEPFFIWQLTLLINNLRELSVPKRNIQILVSFDPFYGINRSFKKFIAEYRKEASFFTYPDSREKKIYQPSIRPHILKQHFTKHQSLQKKTIFYIDSDVLFSRIPSVDLSNKVCYVSNTRNYLDSKYIMKQGSEHLLQDMAETVGLPVKTIISNDRNAGGAQYILKAVDDKFWEKVEKNSNEIYEVISNYSTRQLKEEAGTATARSQEKTLGAMSWCSDMWAVLWNLWYLGHEVKIDSELDFLWPSSSMSQWHKKAVLHYTGASKTKSQIFRKANYKWFPPWFDPTLLSISRKTCSWIVYQEILKVKEKLLMKRKKLNSCLIIYSEDGLKSKSDQQIVLAKELFKREYACEVIAGNLRNGKIRFQQKDLDYLQDSSSYLRYLIVQPAGYLLCPTSYSKYLQSAQRKKVDSLVISFSKSRIVDNLHQSVLSLSLDFDFLTLNKDKFSQGDNFTEMYLIRNPFDPKMNNKQKFLLLDELSQQSSQKTRIRNTYLILNV